MSTTPTSMDMVRYRNFELANVPFNRLAVLTVEAFITTLHRSSKTSERDTRAVSEFIISNQGAFSIIEEVPLEQVLAFWETAASHAIAPSGEYMVNVLMELNSVFRSLTATWAMDEIVGLLTPIYPKMALPGVNSDDMREMVALKNNYHSSQAYASLPDSDYLASMFKSYSWVIPWIIISHIDHRLLTEIVSHSALVVAEKQEAPKEEAQS